MLVMKQTMVQEPDMSEMVMKLLFYKYGNYMMDGVLGLGTYKNGKNEVMYREKIGRKTEIISI